MSKRSDAKVAIYKIINRENINSPRELPYHWNAEQDIHDTLRFDYGYENHGTRKCIIAEMFRDVGLAPKRDSYRTKTYRFEDFTLLMALPADVGSPRPLHELEFLLAMLCEDLQIKKPSLEVGKAKRKSYARGSTKIVLAESMMNTFVLIHELSHIYGNATKTAKGHCQNFLAIEFAILTKLGYQNLPDLFNLAKEHKIPVNENFARNVLHIMRQGDE